MPRPKSSHRSFSLVQFCLALFGLWAFSPQAAFADELSFPKEKPKPAAHSANVKASLALSGLQLGVEIVDLSETRSHFLEARRTHGYFHEHNPIFRAELDKPALLYGQAAAGAALSFFLSNAMAHSQHRWIRKLRYAPQMIQIGESGWGIAYSESHWHHRAISR